MVLSNVHCVVLHCNKLESEKGRKGIHSLGYFFRFLQILSEGLEQKQMAIGLFCATRLIQGNLCTQPLFVESLPSNLPTSEETFL